MASTTKTLNNKVGIVKLLYPSHMYGILKYLKTNEFVYFTLTETTFKTDNEFLNEITKGLYVHFNAVAGPKEARYPWKATKVWPCEPGMCNCDEKLIQHFTSVLKEHETLHIKSLYETKAYISPDIGLESCCDLEYFKEFLKYNQETFTLNSKNMVSLRSDKDQPNQNKTVAASPLQIQDEISDDVEVTNEKHEIKSEKKCYKASISNNNTIVEKKSRKEDQKPSLDANTCAHIKSNAVSSVQTQRALLEENIQVAEKKSIHNKKDNNNMVKEVTTSNEIDEVVEYYGAMSKTVTNKVATVIKLFPLQMYGIMEYEETGEFVYFRLNKTTFQSVKEFELKITEGMYVHFNATEGPKNVTNKWRATEVWLCEPGMCDCNKKLLQYFTSVLKRHETLDIKSMYKTKTDISPNIGLESCYDLECFKKFLKNNKQTFTLDEKNMVGLYNEEQCTSNAGTSAADIHKVCEKEVEPRSIMDRDSVHQTAEIFNFDESNSQFTQQNQITNDKNKKLNKEENETPKHQQNNQERVSFKTSNETFKTLTITYITDQLPDTEEKSDKSTLLKDENCTVCYSSENFIAAERLNGELVSIDYNAFPKNFPHNDLRNVCPVGGTVLVHSAKTSGPENSSQTTWKATCVSTCSKSKGCPIHQTLQECNILAVNHNISDNLPQSEEFKYVANNEEPVSVDVEDEQIRTSTTLQTSNNNHLGQPSEAMFEEYGFVNKVKQNIGMVLTSSQKYYIFDEKTTILSGKDILKCEQDFTDAIKPGNFVHFQATTNTNHCHRISMISFDLIPRLYPTDIDSDFAKNEVACIVNIVNEKVTFCTLSGISFVATASDFSHMKLCGCSKPEYHLLQGDTFLSDLELKQSKWEVKKLKYIYDDNEDGTWDQIEALSQNQTLKSMSNSMDLSTDKAFGHQQVISFGRGYVKMVTPELVVAVMFCGEHVSFAKQPINNSEKFKSHLQDEETSAFQMDEKVIFHAQKSIGGFTKWVSDVMMKESSSKNQCSRDICDIPQNDKYKRTSNLETKESYSQTESTPQFTSISDSSNQLKESCSQTRSTGHIMLTKLYEY